MLHIINKSPLANSALDSCLRVVGNGDILLIEDAVYAATSGSAMEATMREAMKRLKVHVLQPDLDARGMADHVIDGVNSIDYAGFVDLVAQSKNCQSWL
jgi:tRNA 2-thiouridine synthesizing protein B